MNGIQNAKCRKVYLLRFLNFEFCILNYVFIILIRLVLSPVISISTVTAP
jgi:hypothetical protein